MKVCAACCQELPKEGFSKKQWQLKQHQRRCKACVEAGAPLPPRAPPAKKSNDDDESQSECWICLDGGPDEGGGPLRRDCSCRGQSGFAHLSCLEQYAAQKSKDGFDPWEHKGNPWR